MKSKSSRPPRARAVRVDSVPKPESELAPRDSARPRGRDRSLDSVPPPTHRRAEDETGFTTILRRMLEATPGAIAAALVDVEGETVDYAGASLDPFDLKVAAAEFRIVLVQIESGPLAEHGGALQRLEVRGARRTFVVDALPDGYALLSVLTRSAAVGHAGRAVETAMHDLYIEAGWQAPPELHRWHEVDVKLARDGKPRLLRGEIGWRPVAVIGTVVGGLHRGETGFRVALQGSGTELTLVRGRDDRWWADLPAELLTEG